MRRFLSAAVAVLLASGLVLVGAPAYAVEPPPPPVAESPYSSTTLRQTSSPFAGGPMTEAQKAERAMRYSLLQGTNTGGAVDAPDKAPLPAGRPSLLARVAGGAGILTAGVLVVPMLVEGGISMVGISAEMGGQSYDEVVCGGLGSTSDGGFLEWLYGDLDCTPAIVGPNSDVEAGWSAATWNGGSIRMTFTRVLAGTPNNRQSCFEYTAPASFTNPENGKAVQLHAQNPDGSWSPFSAPAFIAFNTSPTSIYQMCLPHQPAPIYYMGSTGVYTLTDGRLAFRETGTTGAVLGAETHTTADPQRQVTCDVEWSDGSVTTGTAVAYRESEGFPLSDVDCQGAYEDRPAGATPVGISIKSDQGGTTTELAEFDVPADLEDPQPARGLRLEKVVAGVVQSCMTWEADCVGWWEATEQGTLTTSPYRCLFGDAQIDLAECGLYRYTFDVKTSTPTITDPVTGEQIDWRPGPDDGRNSTSPGTGPTPGEDCLNNWPSIADPISWVLHPVKCALVWAFVPRDSEVARLTGELTSMWEDTGVGLTVNTITAWEFAAPSSGCGGVLVPMSTIFQHGVEDFRLLDACAGSPLQQTAVWSYWIILIASIINLIASITRNVGSVVGARGVAEGDEK